MALSDKKILDRMKDGTVVIEPFDRKNLSTSSYDVTLGEWYFREKPPQDHKKVFNLYSKSDNEKVWGAEPHRAKTAKQSFSNFNFNYDGIRPEDKVILLEPGETILAHTNEFIGGRTEVTSMMKARSSMGRSFINVCKCAGWGDVGYINRWTMEIQNSSQHYIIPLVVGRRIAQMVFYETGPIAGKDYAETGKYNPYKELKDLKKNWDPHMMLPKLYKDRDIRKKK